ncbi:hypothetical protein K1T71_001569 [Dendrolimus kikuchii]|uniref:Uncharacterized protein n=1 Tax=Dendrolimus kikuchii TaxID=765133 RepID=A0ACC1DEH8_9NEOP|nr:hypothetical protein K1T71_001569 [Dendrolimus kikuchii]
MCDQENKGGKTYRVLKKGWTDLMTKEFFLETEVPSAPATSQLIFLMEPPPRLSFSNSTGARVSCAAHGAPAPVISWMSEDGALVTDVPGLSPSPKPPQLIFPSWRCPFVFTHVNLGPFAPQIMREPYAYCSGKINDDARHAADLTDCVEIFCVRSKVNPLWDTSSSCFVIQEFQSLNIYTCCRYIDVNRHRKHPYVIYRSKYD